MAGPGRGLQEPLLRGAGPGAERPGSGAAAAEADEAPAAGAQEGPATEQAAARGPAARRSEQSPGSESPATVRADRLRAASQAVRSLVLLLSCLLAAALILSEAAEGVRRSLYCRLAPHRRSAPPACVAPLAGAAVACHAAVVAGLGCVARFAWRTGGGRAGAGPELERHCTVLRADLRAWRSLGTKVLLVAGVTYLVAGAPCAGYARLAFIFLATGFLTLYATALFFDDEFEHARMAPRVLRFLGVYTLVGMTFIALSSGVTDLSGKYPAAEDESKDGRYISQAICSSSGRRRLSPAECTVPLDLAAVTSLWWAASPLFSALLSAHGGGGELRGGLRQVLQRWRRCIDFALLGCVGALLLAMRSPCRQKAPVSFSNAELGAWTLVLLIFLRRASPIACDGWRGPLEHLVSVSGPGFALQQCAVCLMDLSRHEDVCRTPCGHAFHRDCLEEWVLSKRYQSPDCPLCREPLVVQQNLDVARCLEAVSRG